MIVDTSAIMSMVLKELDKDIILEVLSSADRLSMSAGSWVELQAILTRRGNPILETYAADLFDNFDIVIAPVTMAQAQIARAAYRQYGRGTRHRADLNFGECFSYALSKESGESLLFRGENFFHTDVVAAL